MSRGIRNAALSGIAGAASSFRYLVAAKYEVSSCCSNRKFGELNESTGPAHFQTEATSKWPPSRFVAGPDSVCCVRCDNALF